MSKNLKILYIAIIVIVFVALGFWYLSKTSSTTNSQLNNVATIQSSGKYINSFSFMELNPEVDGAVDDTNYTVNLLVPSGTNIINLIPTIVFSDNATISRKSGVAQDFTNPVTYIVTAQDGTTQSYVVTVAISSPGQSNSGTTTQNSSDKLINSFAFMGLSPEVAGVIYNNGYTINLTVPVGTDVTNLVPTITISDNATIYPYSGIAQNFTNPIIYTVTAQDGSIQDYTVTISTAQTTQ